LGVTLRGALSLPVYIIPQIITAFKALFCEHSPVKFGEKKRLSIVDILV
jgi:hypothetical protein